MSDVLNRTTGPQIVRLYDVCFKQGVLDACELDDDLATKDFLSARKEDWNFGILGKPDDYDWKAFRAEMYWWARRSHLTSLGDNYIFKIRAKNYLWCVLPYCMRFYLMGIEEWLAYPNSRNIEVFKVQSRIHWSPSADVKRFTTGDYIYYMQDFAHEYRRLQEDNRPISVGLMDEFCKAIYCLTRKHV